MFQSIYHDTMVCGIHIIIYMGALLSLSSLFFLSVAFISTALSLSSYLLYFYLVRNLFGPLEISFDFFEQESSCKKYGIRFRFVCSLCSDDSFRKTENLPQCGLQMRWDAEDVIFKMGWMLKMEGYQRV